ncbi:MAG TPA: exopolysaccharide biosynthesis polyprenyl glycosylphosphotransferase [Candidatus Didemnitutus sp.]|nr:exopolysaccharide biosynthesis polyprenyl glycosylphosphotransferase [Candidatus Didemnitutus sp.]
MSFPRQSITLLFVVLDLLCLAMCFNIVGYAHGVITLDTPLTTALALPIVAMVVGIYLIDGYNPRTDMLSVTYASQHVVALGGVLLFTLLLTYVFLPSGFTLQTSRFVIMVSYLAVIPITLAYRRAYYLRKGEKRQQRFFVFLGSPENCLAFKEECRNHQMQQAVLFATHETFARSGAPPGGSTAGFGDIVEYLDEYAGRIDAIILRESSHDLPGAVVQKLVDLQFVGVPTYTLELFHQVYWRKIPLYRLNQTWLFQEGFPITREPVFLRLKRLWDIAFALVGLLLFAPIFPLVALAIRLDSEGPVFFHQLRVGRNRVPFHAIKLRTMRPHSEDALYTKERDERITRFGRLLRNARIDEIPQLWNVLRGDMSLIGPRAEWVKLVDDYEKRIPCYHFRHLVKPGITGWAQVNFPYGSSLEDTLRKLEYDLYYIRYFSFVLDASIVLKTIQVMLFGKGR